MCVVRVSSVVKAQEIAQRLEIHVPKLIIAHLEQEKSKLKEMVQKIMEHLKMIRF